MSNAQSGTGQPLVEPLSARELEILSHMADHQSNQEIADALVLSLNTVKWYARQIYDKLGVSSRQEAVSRARELGLLNDGTPGPLPKHNLPAQLTPFVGRQEQVATISELMAEPASRLLTVIGPGGIGKTRLAIHAAWLLRSTHQASFKDGIFFVALAPLHSSESLLAGLAQATGFSFYQGGESAEQQFQQYLRPKRMLLVLDNIEHLLDAESIRLLTEALAAAPGLRMMVTSRTRLNVRGEHLVSLDGMDIPEMDALASWQDPAERAAAYSGIQLFVHGARRVRPEFELASDNVTHVAQICSLVQGVPLGIELAAAWLTVFEPEEIAAKIEESLDFLETDASDVPDRQRSLRAVSDYSWSLLTGEEQQAVQRLSLFRGGFDLDGAEQAGGVGPKTLLGLVNKCWIQREAGGRFQIHELLRQYGAERLAGNAALEATAHDQHSRYYCEWLCELESSLNDPERPPAWDKIQGDIENVRAACMWAARQGRLGRLERAVNGLGRFYVRGYGNYQQGRITFRALGQALGEAESWPSSAKAGAQRTMARVLAWQGSTSTLLGDLQTGRRLIDESLALLNSPALADEDTRPERAHITFELGYSRLYTNPESARALFSESLELYREIDHNWGLAYALLGLGRAYRNLGALGEAREAMTQSISLHGEIGNEIGESEAMAALGGVAMRQLRFEEAEDLIRQSLSLTPESNRFGIAYGLGFLGDVQLLTGRFAEAEATLLDSIALYEDLGWRVWAARRSISLAEARLHAGTYDAARIQAGEMVSRAREWGWGRGISYGKLLLGKVALAQAAYGSARRSLEDGLLGLRDFVDDPGYGDESAWLGLAARGLGHRVAAWQHLAGALDSASKRQQYDELMVALAGIALLLADEAETERAIALYALVSRQPFVANSQWFEDAIGQHIAAAAGSLPPAVVATAQERGRGWDLGATVDQLSAELRGCA